MLLKLFNAVPVLAHSVFDSQVITLIALQQCEYHLYLAVFAIWVQEYLDFR